MSATNRGAKRSAADFYPTPLSAFEPLLPFLNLELKHWEPACGDGRLVRCMEQHGLDASGSDLSLGCDFLNDCRIRQAIVTNPPFSLAQEFCDHAIRHSMETWMLLRLNFLGSKKRRDWWRKNEPKAIFVLSERPDFTGGGGDACDYGWFFWSSNAVPRLNGIHHL